MKNIVEHVIESVRRIVDKWLLQVATVEGELLSGRKRHKILIKIISTVKDICKLQILRKHNIPHGGTWFVTYMTNGLQPVKTSNIERVLNDNSF